MFKFLKDKIKKGIESLTKKISTEAEDVEGYIEEKIETTPEPVKEPEPVVEKKPDYTKHVPTLAELAERKKKIEVEKEEKALQEQKQRESEKEQKRLEEEKRRKEKPSAKEALQDIEKIQKTTANDILAEVKKEPEQPRVYPPIEEEGNKSFLTKIKDRVTKKKLSEQKFDELFWDLEVVLLENNVAVEVIDKIKLDLKIKLTENPISRSKIADAIHESLKETIVKILDVGTIDVINEIRRKKPYVICFVGINGSGKTTTIAKFVKLLEKNGLKCVLAASDTYRAAAIQQLEEHANKLGVKMIKHDYGADPAAVAFDAIQYAKSKNIDCVLVDTAGRMHNNANLVDEMKKIIRVANPDLKIFVGEAITGNDCVEQAKKFNEAINIDGIILSKADIDEKGGAFISVGYVTRKPILYIGTGQEYDDMKKFNLDDVLDGLGLL